MLAAAVFGAFIAVVSASAAPHLSYQKIATDGHGSTFDDALQSALILAVGQVNGTQVAQRVVSKKVIGSYREQSEASGAAARNTTTETHAAVVGVGRAVDDQGNSAATAFVGSAVGASTTRESQAYAQKTVSQGDFSSDIKVISAASETDGIVNRYQVLRSTQTGADWTVSIIAEIAVYNASDTSKRLKVAVLPLRLEKSDPQSIRFEQAFRTELVNQLSQTGKLALLDRDFTNEADDELDFIQNGGAKKDEMAKLGNRLGADYIIVGIVSNVRVVTETRKIDSINKVVHGATWAEATVSYRLIEAATGVVESSDSVSSKGRSAFDLKLLANTFSETVSTSIVHALFPIRIERVSGGVFYLGQGGKAVRVGQRFRVIRQGEAIVDSYTNEVLGREEVDLGEIQITEVEPRFSKAKPVANSQFQVANVQGLIARAVAEKDESDTSRHRTNAVGGTKPAAVGAKALLEKAQGSY